MTDTNGTRREFEAWMHANGKGRANAEMFEVDANGDYILTTIYAIFYGWQAATKRATALERERCAKVCDSRFVGDLNREDLEARRCAAAIRQGGDT